MDAVEVGARHVETAGHGAGRDQEAVIAQAPIALQEQLLAGRRRCR